MLAAREAGLPVTVGFTVETDGRLPDGTALRAAVEAVDEAAPPDWFVVNCAHPSHVTAGLADAGPWLGRIGGTRVNASALSHAELDAARGARRGRPRGARARPGRAGRAAARPARRRRLLRHRRPARRRDVGGQPSPGVAGKAGSSLVTTAGRAEVSTSRRNTSGRL